MNLRYFIDRPILSAVISVAIVLMGMLALVSLPVEQYPDIAPPTIQVYTNWKIQCKLPPKTKRFCPLVLK